MAVSTGAEILDSETDEAVELIQAGFGLIRTFQGVQRFSFYNPGEF